MYAHPQAARQIIRHPARFLLQVLKGFHANQGLLLSGAVAYYTLLSLIPLFTLLMVALSQVVDQVRLMAVLSYYLDLLVPAETEALMEQLRAFLENREVLGWVLLGVLIFFSSMAFSVLENAMSVIFFHRVAIRRRHFLISALLPYLFIMLLGLGFLVVTLITGVLQVFQGAEIHLLGWGLPLGGLFKVLVYLIGLGGEMLMLTSIYLVMPVGNLSLRHAVIGGVTATLLWEITRHVLVWYFSTLSFVNVVYGSLATAIVALLSLEIAAMILLLGAQVIAEYERYGKEEDAVPSPGLHT